MNKNKAFTLIEVLVSASILIVALTGVFLIFNFGQAQSPIELERVDVSARARIIMDRIVNDLRGAEVTDIDENTPSDSYVGFYKLQGVDLEARGEYVFWYNCEEENNEEICSFDYIEYYYDENNKELTRSFVMKRGLKNSPKEDRTEENRTEILFKNIAQAPFVDAEHVQSNNFITVEIRLEKTEGVRTPASASLTQEVKIRNE